MRAYTTNYTVGVCLSLRIAELGVEPSDVTSWPDDVISDMASVSLSLTSKLHRFIFRALSACGHSLTSLEVTEKQKQKNRKSKRHTMTCLRADPEKVLIQSTAYTVYKV